MSLFLKSSTANDGTYSFTLLGNISIVVLIIAILLLSCAFFGKKLKLSPKQLAFTSVTLAIAFLTSFIKLFNLPMGGSITLFSMLFVTLIGYWYGIKIGITAGVAFGLLQLIVNPYIISLPQTITDYNLAFGALGLSGIFTNSKHGLIKGYIAGVFGRFVFAVLSGVIFFSSYTSFLGMTNSFAYSVAYNGIYLFSEMALTLGLLALSSCSKSFTNGLSYITKLATGENMPAQLF